MKILVLNCGSSSLKYQLIDMTTTEVLAKGLCERIGINDSKTKHSANNNTLEIKQDLSNHSAAIKLVIQLLLDGVIDDINEIDAVGHRVVHGGEFFSKSVVIDDEVKGIIEKCIELAPLHNPPNLIGINACEELMPNVKQVAVFDTAFHQTIPNKAFLYALPYELYEKYKIRRYGFHGTSHQYVSQKAAELLHNDNLKLISCHLGNGASVCAISNGKSQDTSMGFTPLEGLAMGTRCGDIDPAIITFIAKKENLTLAEVDNMLNKESGMAGLSCVSSDFRDIESKGTMQCELALDIFYYRVAKYIGAYAAAMNGVDAIIFTAGLGENSALARKSICEYLTYLDAKLDAVANEQNAIEISTPESKVKLLVIPTNEELMIAKETMICSKA